MPQYLLQQYGYLLQNITFLFLFINAILHLVFAGAVAKDGGSLYKLGQKTMLVSAATWAFATLIGGVPIAAVYWFIHHSTLTRPTMRADAKENFYDRA